MALLTKTTTARRGTATVEMALVLPLLLLLTFGIIEYGWMFLKSQQITHAARQGARVASTANASTMDAMMSVAGAMNDAGMTDCGYQVDVSPSNVGGMDTGEFLTVSVNVPYENIRLLGLPFIPAPSSLRASTTMSKEGP